MMHQLALVAAIVILALVIYGILSGCLWLAAYIDAQDLDQ